MAKAPAKAAPKIDPLDALADGDPFKAVALLLWKGRFRNPEMAVQITPADIKGFQDCMDYLKVTPEVHVHRPQGRPAQVGVPERQGRPAVPARPAEPPRPYVMIQLVDKDGNAIKPCENNEDDYQRGLLAERKRKARDQAEGLATSLRGELASGDFNKSTIDAICEALLVLAKE